MYFGEKDLRDLHADHKVWLGILTKTRRFGIFLLDGFQCRRCCIVKGLEFVTRGAVDVKG